MSPVRWPQDGGDAGSSHQVLDDLRAACRSLKRARLTVAVMLGSLAVGTGVNVTLYSVVDALLFRAPAGVRDADRLVSVFTSQYNGATYGPTSYPDFVAIKEAAPSFASVAAFDDSTLTTVHLADVAQRARVAAVSAGFFETLRLRPQQGELLPSAMTADAPAAVISDSLWTATGRPPDVLGRPLQIAGTAYRVVGVAPPRFNGLHLARTCDVWVAMDSAITRSPRGDRRLGVVGRLRDGADPADAARELRAAGQQLAAVFPETNRGTRAATDEPRRLTALAYSRLDPASRSQVVLISAVVLGATALLLVSASVNAASLLFSRGAARRREFAVKVALGASRTRLIRQVAAESVLITLGGSVLGLLLAYWTSRALPALFAPEESAMLDSSVSPTLALIVIAVSLAAALAFAVAPARQATGAIEVLLLRGDAGVVGDRSPGSLRTLVVVAQIALSTVLLVASGLMVRALAQALVGDLGPGGRGVAVVLVRMPGALEGDAARGIVFHRAASASARQLPGVRSAAWVSVLPAGRSNSQVFTVEAGPGLLERLEADVNVASVELFSTMRIPHFEGRLFSAADTALSKPVVVVNDRLARRYFKDTAVGGTLRDATGAEYEIVGVVGSGRHRTLQEAPEPTVYFPLSQRHQSYMHLLVRTDGPPDSVLAALPERLSSIDPGVLVARAVTFEQHLAEALTLDRILTTVVGACGLAALLLATIGVYGVVADAVRRRTPEIGLRVALGAPHWRIGRLVLGEGLPLTIGGSAVGIALSLLVARVLRSFVAVVPPLDLSSLAVVPAALVLIALGAAALPVRDALRVNPKAALRAD